MDKFGDILKLIGHGDTLTGMHLLFSYSSEELDPLLELNRALYANAPQPVAALISETRAAHLELLHNVSGKTRSNLLFNLGCLAMLQEEVIEARIHFGEAVKEDAGNYWARHNLAYANDLMAEVEDARAEYEQIIGEYPDFGLSRLNLAQLKIQNGQYDDGLADLLAMVRDQPANLGFVLYACRALLSRGTQEDATEALFMLEDSGELGPYEELQECKAKALMILGKTEDAETLVERLLQQSQDNLFAHLCMVKILAGREDFAGVLEHAEIAEQLDPSAVSGKLLELLREL